MVDRLNDALEEVHAEMGGVEASLRACGRSIALSILSATSTHQPARPDPASTAYYVRQVLPNRGTGAGIPL